MPPEPPSVSRRTPNPQEPPPKSKRNRVGEKTAVKRRTANARANGHTGLFCLSPGPRQKAGPTTRRRIRGFFTQGGGPPCRYTQCNTPCHCRDGDSAVCKDRPRQRPWLLPPTRKATPAHGLYHLLRRRRGTAGGCEDFADANRVLHSLCPILAQCATRLQPRVVGCLIFAPGKSG